MTSRPRVVALGGGHGLAATLQAARQYSDDVTAVVSVADDGGSSGRLRDAFGIPAPGDLRKCLVALGNPTSLWAKAFNQRFESGELEGHAFGNLVIAGLARASGDFMAALDEAAKLVGCVGRVLPATTVPVVLKAAVGTDVLGDGEYIEGQVAVANTARINQVELVPGDAPAPEAALEAITSADQVVIGPGSLYTSVLAVVAVPALAEHLARTDAQKVYVCNLRPQQQETAGYDAGDHLAALKAHGLKPDVTLLDPTFIAEGLLPLRCVKRDLARPDGLAHDPGKLAAALSGLLA